MQNIKILKPTGLFTNYIYKAIPLAFDESMSYYETLCGLLDYLKNTVIPTVNNNADAVSELQNLYNELHDYVEHYFDNLDVQDEINNKLDEMVEQGTLQEIIADYLNSKAIFGFDNVQSMKNATNLIDGSYARTLGYYEKNDGGSGLYKIRTITNDDVVDDGSIIELNNNLVAELIIDKSITPEQFGAYGDGEHNDTIPFTNALKINKPIMLKDNSIYNIVKIYTSNISNIIIYANNKSTIKWNITSTSLINNFEGMFTDDNPSVQADPNGGNVYLKNIIFNGNGNNIIDFPNEHNFGMFHLKARDYVKVENCKFEKIHCDGINLKGYKTCEVINCEFENIGIYQNADGTRNGLTISREYKSRVDNQDYSLTDTPITKIENCKFSHIADECVRIDGCSNFIFENNYCEYIGQHIIESGHNTDAVNYVATILNCVGNNIGQGIYTFGADGGGNWNYTGKILVENSKFNSMCYQDDFSQYKRNARPYIIPGYNANYSIYSPDIEIINCEFKSVNSTLTYDNNQKMIFGKNVSVKDSIFEYYNSSGSIPMFQGVNINLDNVNYKINEQIGSKFGINGLGGKINIYNSTFEMKSFNYFIDVNNCDTYIENCNFIEDTDSTNYRYLCTIRSDDNYKSSISMINSTMKNKDVSGNSSNCYVFASTEGGSTYILDIIRLIGNYYTLNNLNSKSYEVGNTSGFNLLINTNNNKYNA